MSSALGTPERPLRVAIIGAGPSGFYAAQALLAQRDYAVSIDIIEQLPAPYGLVRYGVAPDHQKIKTVTKVYDKIAEDPRVRFLGHVTFGKDLTHEDVRRHYDQVIYAVGAQTDRRLGIPGEDLIGSYPATEFVAWYNGHPDYADRTFDFSCRSVAVIGVGNVAMDVARILALSPAELEQTDIADYALEALRQSRIEDIYVIARRGPAQVKFTNPELRELAELEVADVIVDPAELELDPASAASIADNREAQTNIEILQHYAMMGPSGRPKRIHFLFLRSPVEIIGDEHGRVKQIRLERNELRPDERGGLVAHGIGQFETLDVGMVLRSIGYKGEPLPGVPFHSRWGIIPNEGGRVVDDKTGAVIPGEYCVGWIKRGPTGIIGTNKPDAVATVRLMLEDVPHLTPVAAEDARPEAVTALLQQRGVRYITWQEWQMIDEAETAAGARLGRPRVKFTSVRAMLEAVERALEAATLDVLVVGGGPAGLYAGFYAALRQLKTRVLEAMPVVGGQLSALYPELTVYDVPGFSKIDAKDLAEALRQQAERFRPTIEIETDCRAEQIERLNNGVFAVRDQCGRVHRARKIILAVGIGAITPVKLDNPSVARFEGKGVYYFARDRAPFRGQKVLVVGGGDSAVLWALNLKDYADKVTLIHRRESFRAREAFVAELMASGIDVRLCHELKEVQGKARVEKAVIVDNRTGAESELEVDAVILALGFRSDRRLIETLGLKMNGQGIEVDGMMQTSVEGIYAIGDVTRPRDGVNLKLIATALAQAAVAANHACHALKPDKPLIPPHSSFMRL